MKRKKVWRYYCDHCKKSGCSGGWISRHEKRCTANPDRVCGFCRLADIDQVPIHVLTDTIHDEMAVSEPISVAEAAANAVKALRDKTEGCPACILAAIRQSGLRPGVINFDFKSEAAAWFSCYNNEQAKDGYY